MQPPAIRGSRAQRVGALACAAACMGFGGRAREPRGVAVAEPTAQAAVADVGDAACRATIAADLRAGERAKGNDPCAFHRDRVGARLIASTRPRPVFGIVEEMKPRLPGVALVLSVAHHCTRWPLRSVGEPSLAVGEVAAFGCRVRRYHGPLALDVVAVDGSAETIHVAATDEDGRVYVPFAELDALLRARGRPGLFEHATLLLGADGWAGRVDLAAVRAQLADWHLTWVTRGRGLPGLFAALHPDHPEAQAMRGRALQATLKRQEADAKAVERGELSPRRFLERHVWSPYRSLVAGKAEEAGAEDRTGGTGP